MSAYVNTEADQLNGLGRTALFIWFTLKCSTTNRRLLNVNDS